MEKNLERCPQAFCSQELDQKLSSGTREELAALIRYYASAPPVEREALFGAAREQRRCYYGDRVYFRGLIEFSNYCKNNCYYCGIRRSNAHLRRYRLSRGEILDCCAQGHRLGFRTFVLQSGEDPYYTDVLMCDIIGAIKKQYPDCAVTLSLGEKPVETYRRYFAAGADRYLLRHESASEPHYRRLHPGEMSPAHRKECLYTLKEIGFQVGAGFMVESPYQTYQELAEDLFFLRELQPHMIGLGPFIPHQDTLFRDNPAPGPDLTLVMLALTRLMLPKALIPATTALGTIDPLGREKGLQAGANVVMPNLSPVQYRKDYALYDNKICTGEEAAECLGCLSERIRSAGFQPDFSRGDHTDLARADHAAGLPEDRAN
ncbi:MAG: [FeFe] hydrogenase H-cluster radical SAM maturase HydE [Clostridia bacterium]|jgi:biotin synthase|nr:[FeFe] hydrogenase H-cluster radical SAM maturase HydE [Clostridia bacterium]